MKIFSHTHFVCIKIAGKTFSSDLRKPCLKTGESLSPPTKLILFKRKSPSTLSKQEEKSTLTQRYRSNSQNRSNSRNRYGNSGRDQSRGRQRFNSNDRENNRTRSRSSSCISTNRDRLRCYRCSEYDHFARECPNTLIDESSDELEGATLQMLTQDETPVLDY